MTACYRRRPFGTVIAGNAEAISHQKYFAKALFLFRRNAVAPGKREMTSGHYNDAPTASAPAEAALGLMLPLREPDGALRADSS